MTKDHARTIEATREIADAVYLLAISEGPLRGRLQLVKPIILQAATQEAPADLKPELEMLQTWISYSEFPAPPLGAGRIEVIEYVERLLRLCFALLSRSATAREAAALLEPPYESSGRNLSGGEPQPC